MTTSTSNEATVAYQYLADRQPREWSKLKGREQEAIDELISKVILMRESIKLTGQFKINFGLNGILTSYDIALHGDFKETSRHRK